VLASVLPNARTLVWDSFTQSWRNAACWVFSAGALHFNAYRLVFRPNPVSSVVGLVLAVVRRLVRTAATGWFGGATGVVAWWR
jgi:RsiW-degrading membrane proteinase PrsW (M82 family)